MSAAGAVAIVGINLFTGLILPIIIIAACLIVYCVAIYKICKISKHDKKHDKEAKKSVELMS